jgi:hypothetical protein
MASGVESSYTRCYRRYVVSVLVLDRGKTGLIGIAAVFAIAFLLLAIRTSKRSLPASDI